MPDPASATNNAVSSVLSALTGSGKISGKSPNDQITINPAASEAGVLAGIGGFNAVTAKVVAAAKKQQHGEIALNFALVAVDQFTRCR